MLAAQQAKLKPAGAVGGGKNPLVRKKTINAMIQKADAKASVSKNQGTLSLAEQLQAAQKLLKPVDRESLAEEKKEAIVVKRETEKKVKQTANITILAAQIQAAVNAKEKQRKARRNNSDSDSSSAWSSSSDDDSDY